MNTWFTSDTHFNHANILKYIPSRAFSTIEEHDKCLIDSWNSRVKSDDWVFHLGDFGFGNLNRITIILDQLKGRKILISGNHDFRFLKRIEFVSKWERLFYSYKEIKVIVENETFNFVLCHYPLESFNKMRYGAIHLHGHSHNVFNQPSKLFNIKNRIDVGVDSNLNFAPWSKKEIIDKIR